MIQMDPLVVLRGEVLRWNKSFNLVSRQNPEERTDALIDECVAAGEVILGLLGGAPLPVSIQYVDLGTGGGFPGLVWHQVFSRLVPADISFSSSLLVEPREKRAWFLQQAAQEMKLSGVSVVQERWGAGVVEETDGFATGLMLVSMKALALSDQDVLGGLSRSYPAYSGPCLIARFISAGEVVNKTQEMRDGLFGSLVDSLSWGDSSECCTFGVSGKTQNTGLLLSWCP